MRIFLVGGAVRDSLLERPGQDRDYVVVGGTEDELRLRVPGLTRVGKGIPVFLKGQDQYTLSAFANIEADLASRDLTVNALARDEDGRIIAHPGALDDLRAGVLRPVATSNFQVDPLRAIRAARFAAQLPLFAVHEELLAAMRLVPEMALGSVAGERVGQEMLKACSGPQPGRFLRVLAAGGCLNPWLAELSGADAIPAGPPQHHDASVLEHTARVMDQCAGDAVTVWMALCHDLGKTGTPVGELPRHHGHEQRGEELAEAVGQRLRLPQRVITAGRLAARWHMAGGTYVALRPATIVRLLLTLDRAGIVERFFRLVLADGGDDAAEQAQRELDLIKSVRLPEQHRDRGPLSAQIQLQLRCEALAALRVRCHP